MFPHYYSCYCYRRRSTVTSLCAEIVVIVNIIRYLAKKSRLYRITRPLPRRRPIRNTVRYRRHYCCFIAVAFIHVACVLQKRSRELRSAWRFIEELIRRRMCETWYSESGQKSLFVLFLLHRRSDSGSRPDS